MLADFGRLSPHSGGIPGTGVNDQVTAGRVEQAGRADAGPSVLPRSSKSRVPGICHLLSQAFRRGEEGLGCVPGEGLGGIDVVAVDGGVDAGLRVGELDG